jgi:hypothetical protein
VRKASDRYKLWCGRLFAVLNPLLNIGQNGFNRHSKPLLRAAALFSFVYIAALSSLQTKSRELDA